MSAARISFILFYATFALFSITNTIFLIYDGESAIAIAKVLWIICIVLIPILLYAVIVEFRCIIRYQNNFELRSKIKAVQVLALLYVIPFVMYSFFIYKSVTYNGAPDRQVVGGNQLTEYGIYIAKLEALWALGLPCFILATVVGIYKLVPVSPNNPNSIVQKIVSFHVPILWTTLVGIGLFLNVFMKNCYGAATSAGIVSFISLVICITTIKLLRYSGNKRTANKIWFVVSLLGIPFFGVYVLLGSLIGCVW